MQNIDGRLILTAEVAKNKMAKITKIYFNKVARYNTNLPRGLTEKSEKHQRIVTNKGLKFKMRDNDWLFSMKLQV